jgi:hypothetical protein
MSNNQNKMSEAAAFEAEVKAVEEFQKVCPATVRGRR